MRTVSWGLVVAALHAVLRCGRSAGSCATWRDVAGYWHVLGRGGGSVAGSCVTWRDMAGYWHVLGRGGGLACHIEAAWRGLMRHVEVAWWVGGVLHDVAGSWRVLGWGGGDVAGSWCVLGQGRGESAGGGVLRAVSGWCGGWWRLGLACRVEVAWWVGGVFVCHVGLARWVGGGRAGWRGFAFSRALRAVLGRQGGLAVAGCWGRMEVARVHEWPATSKVLRAVLRGRVGGGGVLRAMSGWRVGVGTNGSGSRAQGDSNGLQR
ncbi:hypothetical protein EDB83DRAFT_2316742 [Lactarius deliciosus]|nr:hypothetical protein EDB83DRAFT_2316742 [Lactarius deliciosus]